MASAWGQSWGSAWGNSWGAIEQEERASGGFWLGAYNDRRPAKKHVEAIKEIRKVKQEIVKLNKLLDKAYEIEARQIEYREIQSKASRDYIAKLKERQNKAQALQLDIDGIERQIIELKAELQRLEEEDEEEAILMLLM